MKKGKPGLLMTIHLNNIFAVVFCFAGTWFISCTVQKVSLPYTLSDTYKTANLATRPVILGLPDQKNIIVTNPKDVVDDYGGVNVTPQSRIEKFYCTLFAESFRSNISSDTLIVADGYRPKFSIHDLEKKQVALKIDDNSSPLHFSIPTKSAMQKAGLDSAIVVLIDRLTFKRNKFYMEYYWDTDSKQLANLEAAVDIVVWDYQNDAPVFYGTVINKVDFQIAMTRKHWDESARSLAKKIVFSVKCL